MNNEDVVIIVIIGIIIGMVIAYFFLWGKPYSDLNQKYTSLQEDYQELNSSHMELRQEYTQLSKECGQLLKKYESCVSRETFFEWVNRLSSLGGLAKLLGLI